jgi:pyrophosphatase PpaX
VTVWICDVHGVLVDSTALVRRAFLATTTRYAIPLTESLFQRVKGLPLLDAYRRLDSAGDAFARRAYHLHYVRERIDGVRACPGVPEVLAEAGARGILIGAATSCGEIAEAVLVNTGLYGSIDCLVTQEEVSRPKPDPEAVLRVVMLLGATSARRRGEVLYVGDTAIDIQAGRAAGVRTAGVTYGISAEAEMAAARPDHMLRSFHEMRQFLDSEPIGVRPFGDIGPRPWTAAALVPQ